MSSERVFLADDTATADLGIRLAAGLKPGDLVLLSGGLGAGKTTLARAMVRALIGDPDMDVPSPSFALVQPYESGQARVLHADFFRLNSVAEVEALGLFDDPGAIVLVEWPERAPALLTGPALDIRIEVPKGGAGRWVEIVR